MLQLLFAHVGEELLFHPQPVCLHYHITSLLKNGLIIALSPAKVDFEELNWDLQQDSTLAANFYGEG